VFQIKEKSPTAAQFGLWMIRFLIPWLFVIGIKWRKQLYGNHNLLRCRGFSMADMMPWHGGD
tara:strand:+ start:309 stop:494 length:186 start_codon:yes stop_codon:yes gene_type:complete